MTMGANYFLEIEKKFDENEISLAKSWNYRMIIDKCIGNVENVMIFLKGMYWAWAR